MKKNGFTLLEILISVGVLAIVSTLIVQVLFTTTSVNRKTETFRDVKGTGEFALSVMERLVRNANANDTVCDVGQTSTASAAFRNADNETTTLICMADGTAARIASKSATGSVVYITGAGVTLSASGDKVCTDSTLTFSCPPVSGITTPMTIEFSLGTLAKNDPDFAVSRRSFQTTVSLRN